MKNETLKDSKGGTYTGEVKNGQPYGQGTFLFANGDKYIGEFKVSFFIEYYNSDLRLNHLSINLLII